MEFGIVSISGQTEGSSEDTTSNFNTHSILCSECFFKSQLYHELFLKSRCLDGINLKSQHIFKPQNLSFYRSISHFSIKIHPTSQISIWLGTKVIVLILLCLHILHGRFYCFNGSLKTLHEI